MAQADRERNRVRATSALGVAAFHVALGYALISSFGVQFGGETQDELKVFDVPEEIIPPPVEETVAPKERTPDPEGSASPPNLKAKASPVVAPPPVLFPPVPLPAAKTADQGSDNASGASDVAGPGTGAGGQGTGTGSGGQGSGSGGGGGAAAKAQWIQGRIANRDYPRAASRAGAEGTVIVRFTVETSGRATGCRVMSSSGNADLDATTCRLIERRFKYRPAKDAQGNPVASQQGWKQVWWLERD